MIPLQVASSGRPGTEPTSRNRTHKNQEGGGGWYVIREKTTENVPKVVFPMIPLQAASSGRPGTEPTNRNRTYKNQEGE